MKPDTIRHALLLITGIVFLANACRSSGDSSTSRQKEPDDLGTLAALPLTYKSPANNPPTPEKIELGRLLFYDPVLSGEKDVACASCHHPEFGYAESLELSIGVTGTGLGSGRAFRAPGAIPFVKRNSQSLLNVAFNGIDTQGNYQPEKAPMFWDLRASGLEEQALEPVRTLEEMRGHGFEEAHIAGEVVTRLNDIETYKHLFMKAFPGEQPAITSENMAKALAAFQRSLVANNSRFDQYMRGDHTAMSARELEGMELFLKAGCGRCHHGPMFSDYKTHVLGVTEHERLSAPDAGLGDTYAFRTPTLRNLRWTRPYMHNGKIPTLEKVMTFYEDLKGKELPNRNLDRSRLDPLAQKLKVDFKHINTILEFLNTLNDDQYDRTIPSAVPSGLPVGGNIH